MLFFVFTCWDAWNIGQRDSERFWFLYFLGLKLDIYNNKWLIIFQQFSEFIAWNSDFHNQLWSLKSIEGKDLWAPQNSLREALFDGGHHASTKQQRSDPATEWTVLKTGTLSETVGRNWLLENANVQTALHPIQSSKERVVGSMQSSLGKCHLCWWRFASLVGVSLGEMLCSSRMFNRPFWCL